MSEKKLLPVLWFLSELTDDFHPYSSIQRYFLWAFRLIADKSLPIKIPLTLVEGYCSDFPRK